MTELYRDENRRLVASAQAFKKTINFDFTNTNIMGKETYTKSSLQSTVSNLRRGFSSR